jgi:hypothetical protein
MNPRAIKIARYRPATALPWPCGMLAVLAVFGLPLAVLAGEMLNNGIELPEAWPPQIKALARQPLSEPAYLKQPPKVIPIDVGRQLFVDDFLIESTTLMRTHHRAEYHPASPVLVPDPPPKGTGRRPRAGVFSDGVWFDPQDQLFKAWYHGGTISETPLHYATCYATSKDGIRWEKPLLDVVPGTNIVLPDEDGLRRNSNTVWLDHFEQDPTRRFKMFRVVQQDYTNESGRKTHRNFIQHHVSADGIHWKLAGQSVDCGDRTTVFFNAHRRRWVVSLREGSPLVSRCRGYYEAAVALGMLQFGNPQTRNHELCLWVGADELDPAREDLKLRRPADRPWDLVPSQLYNLDCVAYESLLIGLFSIWRGHPADEVKRPKINEVCVGFSRDGFHWTRPDRRAFYSVSEDPQAWNYGNVQSAGGCCLVVGDKLHFYAGGTKWGGGSFDPNHTGLAVLRRDGFTSMDAGQTGGHLTTRPVRFPGKHLLVNVAVPQGTLRAEVLDEQGNPIAPFTADSCDPIHSDSTKTMVRWKGAEDLSAASGRPVRFRFHLTNGSLYAFWVSPDASGASHGYVAAGGPGFTGARDTTGR